jgi:hypothetical protein
VSETNRCENGKGSWRKSQCRHPGKVEREGKWYCGTHDPEARAARREAKLTILRAKWEAERVVMDAARIRAKAIIAALGCGQWGGYESITLTFSEAEQVAMQLKPGQQPPEKPEPQK